MQMFEAMRLFLLQQQASEKKESQATDALRSVVGQLDQFDGKNISKFLRFYKKEMDVNRVPEDEMVRSFELAVTPELREHVKVLIAASRNNWEQFSRAMREQYFLEDADRVFPVNKDGEDDTGGHQDGVVLRAADPELQERLEMRLEDNEAEGGLTTNWRKVQDAVELLEKQEQRKEKGVIRRFVPAAPAVVPVVPMAQVPVVPAVGQPARPLVPRKDDPSLEDIMKGMRDLV
ncbi:hypothetical protein R1sor_013090 [Riccia sorocarpa]|uniref:Uncharacterized protein n=1 Tax=Riccia sorocarpa TaxID=122646 RepID=A0ABD3H7E4_9MARC